ncbi:MAG: tetratricopeptide repeat protein [Hyphomicrobiaceae bacterium]
MSAFRVGEASEQLRSISLRHQRGEISAAEADELRAELLSAVLGDRQAATRNFARWIPPRQPLIASLAAAAVVLALGVSYFLSPARTLSEVAPMAAEIDPVEALARMSAGGGALDFRKSRQMSRMPDDTASLPSVDDMIERLARRLEQNPDDVEGWRMLGWSYVSTERYDKAVAAYRKAVELRPSDHALVASLGAALVRAADGKVTPEAHAEFRKATALDGTDPTARFFLGLQRAQAGRAAEAIVAWKALLDEPGLEPGLSTEVRAQIARYTPGD